MRSRSLLAAVFVAGLGVGVLLGVGAERRSARASGTTPPHNERAVCIDQPDPSSPTGRRTVRLTVMRVTGGPEGTTEHGPIATKRSPDGVHDLLLTDADWVVSIGQRSYLMTLR